jgi:predicted GNAT family acetyltransferase
MSTRVNVTVTRHASADSFLVVATPLLMMAEAENNLIIGVAHGLARNPSAAKNPYLATVSSTAGVLACAIYLSPSKLVLTRANGDTVAALAKDAYDAVPTIEGVSGPDRSATDFAQTWSELSGVAARRGMLLRIHEARRVSSPSSSATSGHFRAATPNDAAVLSAWTDVFILEAGLPEKVDASAIVGDGIRRGRLHVWEDGGRPVSMAAWAGKTPSGVRINFVYTPPEVRRQGYATACVAELTRQQLSNGSTFCWLYTDRSSVRAPNIFKRIGYWPVSDVTEYYLQPQP